MKKEYLIECVNKNMSAPDYDIQRYQPPGEVDKNE